MLRKLRAWSLPLISVALLFIGLSNASASTPNGTGYQSSGSSNPISERGTPISTATTAPGNPSVLAASCPNGYVGITFDDGPGSNTQALLSILAQNDVKATCFNIGQNAAANPSLVRAEVAGGHWVGNHSYTHPHLTTMSQAAIDSEISRTQSAISSSGGGTPQLFRPPYGETNATLKAVEQKYGLREVIWDVDSQDWNGASQQAIEQANARLTNGQVILMHDAYPNTTNRAIPAIAAGLRSRGLCPGMISPTTGRAVAPSGTSTPPTTTPPTTTPPTTTPTNPNPPAGGCTAVYTSTGSWSGGFTGSVKITAGSGGTQRWSVPLNIPAGSTITSVWNGTRSGNTVSNVAWNGQLNAGQSTEFGFQGTGSGSGITVGSCTA